MTELTPLHTHTVYSILDGMIKIPNYVAWAKENNIKALAITDHGSMAGAIKFYKECNSNDITPILGCEFYMTLGEVEEGQKDNFHLVLLAKNKTGWLNLIKLHNASYYNFKRKPRITFEDIEKHSEGLICLSACLGGLIPQDILNGDMKSLIEHLKHFKQIFGDDFYLEIQDHDTLEEKKVWGKLLELSHKTGIKAIATNDSHYEKQEHAFAHEVLLCKQTVKKISDEKRFKFAGGPEYYLKNTEEMRQTFNCLSEDVWNRILDASEEIVSKIEKYDILQHGYNYPKFDEPQKSFKKLVELSRAGFERRFKGKPIDTKQYIARLKYELETIYKIGFTDYFLVLEDLYKFLDKSNIPTGFGRGSGAGSLVLYTLDVTNLDPIEHDLLFERFINPSRVSAPDVDCDIADVDRPKVIAYLEERYGKDHVANIATYGEMTSVSSFKAVASVLEMPYLEANHITKDMIDTNLSLQENLEQNDELKKMYDTDPLFHKIFDVSQILEGGIDKAGQHACGLIISNQPLENLTPLTYQQDSSGRWVNCAVFDMKEIDGDLQLLKLDILGLKNLSIINETIQKMGIDFDYKNMPFTDEKTFNMISEAKTLGVFQLESEIARKLCRDIKPKTLADLGAINALLRPASLESGVTQQFIDRKNGVEPVKYICEGMEGYTKNTYGLCIFQEQLMQLSRVMAGYTLAEADTLRKYIGKKVLEKLKAERSHFVSGSVNNGHAETYANEVFDMIEKAGRYGFNASHAYAYSAMSYVTAFLKVNHPLEYMTAMLNNNRDKMEKLTPYIDECYRIGINVLSPDLNKSDNIFSFDRENNGILFGFTAIKGIGQSAIEPILLERENGEFKSLKDLIIRCPSTNKTTLENLIMSGALNNIEACPYKYMKPLQVLCKARAKSSYKKGDTDLYTAMIECYVSDIVKKHSFYMDLDKEYKSVEGATKEAKQQKAEIKKKMNDFIQLAIKKFEDKTVETSVTDQEIRQNEIEMVGFPISNNPKKILIELENLIDSTPIDTMLDSHNYSDMFSFMGRFKSVKKTKNGSYFAVITDDTTEITTFMKADTYFEIQDKINTSNYFRFIGQINKSTNEKFADNFKIEGVRLFNVGKSSEIKLISHLDNESLNNFLTNIRNNAIMNMSDINYRLIIYHNDKKLTTKVDYWISNLQEIASEMIKYNITTVKE